MPCAHSTVVLRFSYPTSPLRLQSQLSPKNTSACKYNEKTRFDLNVFVFPPSKSLPSVRFVFLNVCHHLLFSFLPAV